jgi:hypothetical protein
MPILGIYAYIPICGPYLLSNAYQLKQPTPFPRNREPRWNSHNLTKPLF